jgi:hypothetical protein
MLGALFLSGCFGPTTPLHSKHGYDTHDNR